MAFRVLAVQNGRMVGGKFVADVTDRAKRYRANKNVETDRRCAWCGNPKARDVGHIDGDEGNNDPRNLAHSCRSCNVKCGNTLRKRGRGVKTKQYNPRKKTGRVSLGAYLSSVQIMKGDAPGNVDSAVKTVQQTTPAQRSAFAKQIWEIRRERYGPTGRQDSLPF